MSAPLRYSLLETGSISAAEPEPLRLRGYSAIAAGFLISASDQEEKKYQCHVSQAPLRSRLPRVEFALKAVRPDLVATAARESSSSAIMPYVWPKSEAEQIHWLSYFALRRGEEARNTTASMPGQALDSLLQVADLHHVAFRVFEPVTDCSEPARRHLAALRQRNAHTVACAAAICEALDQAGCPAMAIKSTDHWPDLGNDFDLFTTGSSDAVRQILTEQFHAEAVSQSWGDRLACKWNFRVPGLIPLIEMHVGRIGQTGELNRYGEEMVERRRLRTFGGAELWVPAPEDQIVLTTLQRLYRHFFYRICDFTDTLSAMSDALDFEQLRLIAKRHALWQGVSTHLRLVSEYAAHYTGSAPALPAFVRKSARFGIERLYPHAGYLRLPLFPQGATLWGTQVIKTWHRRNRSGALRLVLLPPLAAAAGATYKATGKQSIW